MKNLLAAFTGKKAGRVFLAPTVIMLLLLTIFPFLFSLSLTFGRVSLTGGLSIHFAGIRNWVRLFQDERFGNAMRNTLFIAVVTVTVQYILGLGLAMLLNNERIKGRGVFRVLFLLPMMLSPIAVGYMWRMMFGTLNGPINGILIRLGFGPVEWITNTKIAIYSVILTDIWQWTPFMFLVLFAGLQTIPRGLIEAAQADGASSWQQFRHVIFPLLAPATVAAVLLRLLEAFKIIDIIYILTGGGPGMRTESMTLFGYSKGLGTFDLAYGSTIAFSLFITVIVVSIVLMLGLRRFQEIRLE